jgi:hypothetical protein
VTVTDPRHPLFNQTLPLLSIVNWRDVGHCCVVLVEGISRHFVPVTATNRSAVPVTVWPVRLNLTALQQLVTTYHQIVGSSEDDQPQPATGTASSATVVPGWASSADPHLGATQPDSTAGDLSNPGPGVSPIGSPDHVSGATP